MKFLVSYNLNKQDWCCRE